jgi:hypothetical protein
MAINNVHVPTQPDNIPTSEWLKWSRTTGNLTLGISLAAFAIVAYNNWPKLMDNVHSQYKESRYLMDNKDRLLEADELITGLKKHPWSSIKYDTKTGKCFIEIPLKSHQRKPKDITTHSNHYWKALQWNQKNTMYTNQGTILWEMPNISGNDTFHTPNQYNDWMQFKDTPSNKSEYSTYIEWLPFDLQGKIPTYEDLLQQLGIQDISKIKFILKSDNQLWIYGEVRENANGQKFRLRVATLNPVSGVLDTGFRNRFYFTTEN